MNEHFKEQLENTEPCTEESIQSLKQNRLDNGLSTESLEGIKPGDKFLFVMIEYPGTTDEDGSRRFKLNIEKILEREIDDFEERHEFISMSKTSNIPRYKAPAGENIEN